MIQEAVNEILSFLLILSIPSVFALVGLRRDKVRRDRQERLTR